MNSARGNHETRVDGAAHNTAQRVPGTFVEPVEEVVVAVGDHVMGGTVVEPRVKLVDDALVADHREKTRHEACDADTR